MRTDGEACVPADSHTVEVDLATCALAYHVSRGVDVGDVGVAEVVDIVAIGYVDVGTFASVGGYGGRVACHRSAVVAVGEVAFEGGCVAYGIGITEGYEDRHADVIARRYFLCVEIRARDVYLSVAICAKFNWQFLYVEVRPVGVIPVVVVYVCQSFCANHFSLVDERFAEEIWV